MKLQASRTCFCYLQQLRSKQTIFISFVFVCSGYMDNRKPIKQLSKCHQCWLKKELQTSILSAGLSTNPNWNLSSGGISSLENEWSNSDSDSQTVASSFEGNFDRYLNINEDNLAFLDISFSCLPLEFRWNSHEEVSWSDVEGLPLAHFTILRNSAGRKWKFSGLL